ncbi:hypothetical protein KR044_001097 [Drosophila immigrans]|nr:hypothetical protein KR044_001097 [Drosophila immigrans]
MAKRKSERTTLTGGNRFVWTKEPTEMFLRLWEESIPYLRGVKTRVQVHKEIAEKMFAYQATHVEIKSKMDSMIKRYKKEVKKLNLSGFKSAWEYFDQMHKILKETNYFNAWSMESFDFSPLEDNDTDSNDSRSWTKNDNKETKKLKTDPKEVHAPKTPLDTTLAKSDSHKISTPERPASAHSELSLASHELSTPERPASVKSDYSSPELEYDDEPEANSESKSDSDRKFALEEAKLAVRREELKLMKNMADELSALHREFLKAYKYK